MLTYNILNAELVKLVGKDALMKLSPEQPVLITADARLELVAVDSMPWDADGPCYRVTVMPRQKLAA